MEAKERGAKVIHVDPRFTRTSAMARPARADPRRHRHRVPGRAHRHVLENGARVPRVRAHYTNAPRDHRRGLPRHRGPRRPVLRLARRTRRATTRRPGATRAPRTTARAPRRATRRTARTARARRPSTPRGLGPRAPALRVPAHAPALRPLHARDGRARSAASRGRRSSQVAEALCDNSGRRAHVGASVYAVGWTQHTTGVQNIRAAAILQLLLGNIGRPGGGHPRAARPREHPGLDRHPDALRHPAGLHPDAAPDAGRRSTSGSATTGPTARRLGLRCAAFCVSLLKAWFGDAATRGERLVPTTTCRASTATTRTTRSRCA